MARKQLLGLSRATQYLPELCHSHLPLCKPRDRHTRWGPLPPSAQHQAEAHWGRPPSPSKHLVANLTRTFISLILLWLFQTRRLQGAGPLPSAELGAQADPWALWSRFPDSFTAQENGGPAVGRLPLATRLPPFAPVGDRACEHPLLEAGTACPGMRSWGWCHPLFWSREGLFSYLLH